MGINRKGFQWNIALLLMLLTVVVATFFILIFTYIQERPLASEPQTVDVGGQTITVNTDPNMAVTLVEEEVFAQPAPAIEAEPQPEPQPEPTPEPPPPPPPSPDPITFETYTVQPGNTLYSITRDRIDTNIALLARFNISAKELVAGRTIQIPKGNPDYCPGRRPYAVQEGDTPFSIARRFGISHTELMAMNNMEPNATIYIATIICVP